MGYEKSEPCINCAIDTDTSTNDEHDDKLESYENYYNELLKSVGKNIRFATMTPIYLAEKRNEVYTTLSYEDFANILCYHVRQYIDRELVAIIKEKFIVTPRSFNGYGKLLTWVVTHRSPSHDIVDMGFVVNIKKIEIITRDDFVDVHKIEARYLEVDNPQNIYENDWKVISKFDNAKSLTCDVNTNVLKIEKHDTQNVNAPDVISTYNIFGFIL